MADIERCPWCGTKSVLECEPWGCWVSCTGCEANGPMCDAPGPAFDAWNRLSLLVQAAEERERVK